MLDKDSSKQFMRSRFIWLICILALALGWGNLLEREKLKEEAAVLALGPAINESCPLTTQPVDEELNPTAWRGMSIGFCSQQCADDWDRLSDYEREMAMSDAGISFVGAGAADH